MLGSDPPFPWEGGSLSSVSFPKRLEWIGISLRREGVAAGRFSERFPRRSWAVLNFSMAVMLTLLWVQRIAAALGGDLLVGGLTSETTMTVQALGSCECSFTRYAVSGPHDVAFASSAGIPRLPRAKPLSQSGSS